ncbi:MAG: uidA 3 [Anaerocolumna sp.]|jgi:beta-glucuronidase|nr:uidA 3 [Anaerocolumna sp.]
MIRTFSTHNIRPQEELTGCLWEFSACQGEFANKTYQVATPSCWENYPDFSGYRGEGIYKTSFQASGNIRLEFKGVSHTATVTLDGKVIAHHYNAYTSFSAIVKELPEGVHELKIKADNRFSEASALHIPNDYMSYGGISRPVVLEKLKDVYIKYVHVTPYTKKGSWNAKIVIAVENIDSRSHQITLKTELAGKSLEWDTVDIGAESELILSKEVAFDDVEVWAPENPKLYNVVAVVREEGMEIDDLIDRFGFREVKVEGKKIVLNGRTLRIKGLCRHEDHPQFGCALPYSAIAADIEITKHLGANSLRTAHYPNDEIFLDLCDEQGILVWEENHARGLSVENMKNPNFRPQAEQVIREMIPMHYNHPCIYIWGILNECASDSEYGKECYSKQFDIIGELDTTRPRSFASCKFKSDLCLGLPEVVSYNIYPLWYHDTPVEEYLKDLYEWVQKETEGSGKPFLVTEIGAGGIYGYHNSYNSKWTEEYQAETLEKQITAVMSQPGCSGVYIWQFCDIRVSEEWFWVRPRTMNNKGVVDEYRRKKLAYNVVKRLFESYQTYDEK